MDNRLFKSEYVTEAAAVKALIAGGGVATATLVERLCGLNAAAGVACQFGAGVSDFLKILLAMMALDLVTGVLASRAEGQRIESKRLGVGMKRKVGMLAVITSSVLLDAVLKGHGLDASGLLYQWTASWFIAVEFLSLYENASRIGVPMPTFLKTAVERLLQKGAADIINAIPVPSMKADAPPPANPDA